MQKIRAGRVVFSILGSILFGGVYYLDHQEAHIASIIIGSIFCFLLVYFFLLPAVERLNQRIDLFF